MINLEFSLTNPFSDKFKNLCHKAGHITEHKCWEIDCYRDNRILAFQFYARTRCDHAGIRVELALLSYTISFDIYDSRHWNYTTNTWEVYE